MGCTGAAIRLIAAGADIFASDINGWTPIDIARHYNRKTIVSLLVLLEDPGARQDEDIIRILGI